MEQTKSVFIAIVGKPNAGKSTLLNALVGRKIAIVSDKPQTTRNRITGVLTRGGTQFVFIDTPGLHRPRTKLSEFMVEQIRASVADVDAAVLVTDPTGSVNPAEIQLTENFTQKKIPAVLAVNKIDLLSHKEEMLPKISAFSELFSFDEIIPISAKNCEATDILLDKLERYTQDGPHYFPDDAVSDQPEQLFAAEVIREKLLRNLDQEIPHGTAVVIERLREREDQDLLDIEATIFCERKSHKGIIIGKNGEKLKRVASSARVELEHFFGIRVNLQCWVKVKDDWRNRDGLLRSFGYR